jgi:uncharacterized membrane protein
MSDTGWFLLVALSALALASMTIRGVAQKRGRELVVYLVAMAFCAGGGALIAAAIDTGHCVLGAVCGVAAVEIGPAIGTAVRKVIRAKADKAGGE